MVKILSSTLRLGRATLRSTERSCVRVRRATPLVTCSRQLRLVPSTAMYANPSASRFECATTTRVFSSSAAPCVAIGDKVSIHLTGKVSNGDPFGQEDPITFIVGSGDVITGINDAVIGLAKGYKKHVEIAPEHAFGKQKHIYTVPRNAMRLSPEDDKALAVGQVLTLQNGEHARVITVTDNSIDIDLSHPYAGESLILDITVVDTIARGELKPEEQLVLPEELVAGDNMTFPQRGDTLKMHYTGSLASDKTVFDSSVTRGTPFEFQIGVGQVIKGWDEGVMRMCKGQKAVLRIPPAKGYGKAGAGGVIPPNADLIFEVELLDIIRRQG